MKRHLFVLLMILLMAVSAIAFCEEWGTIGVVRDVNEYITLRETPRRKGIEVDKIPLGGLVVFLGETEDDFSYVTYRGKNGYALTEYLGVVRQETGTEIIPDDAMTINMNLFLTKFSTQWFAANNAFLKASSTEQQMIDFAVNLLFADGYESGDWNGDNARVYGQKVPELVSRYFGVQIHEADQSIYTYRNGYYYSEETGGRINGGFVIIESVEQLESGNYRVHFGIYGEGEPWKSEAVCALSPARAAATYPSEGKHIGIAEINMHDATADPEQWTLESWMDTVVY